MKRIGIFLPEAYYANSLILFEALS
jgi:hypothetical protein